ncbi:MAG: radical SAM protein, partial [Nitrospirae bacterium]
MSARRFYIETLGCPKNQVDSEVLKHKLSEGGLLETHTPEEADYIIVNTCTFIREAKEETIDVVLSLANQKRQGQKLVMLGCMVQRYGDILKRELPEVDHFVGFHDLDEFLKSLDCKVNGSTQEFLPETYPYAYLKIAEGCQRQCTFCVIPSIRGPLRSLPPEDVLKRAEFLVSKGYKEIILIAQDITSYGNDLGKGYGLKDLLKDLAGIDGQFWIKLLYLYPGSVDEALLELIAENKKICPY